MPESARKKLVSAFRGLKDRNIKVLWKWETDQMIGEDGKEEELENIMLKKWLPQQDVLGKRSNTYFITNKDWGTLQE